MVFTLGATDSAGNSTGGEFATVTIINITNLPTTIATTYPCIDDIVVVINDPVALATSATSMATNMTTQSTTPPLSNGGGGGMMM